MIKTKKKYPALRALALEIVSAKPISLRSLVLIIAGSATAFACGWSYLTEDSVRFNDSRSGRSFYRLPPLPIMYDSKTGREITANEVEDVLYPSEDANNETDSAKNELDADTAARIWVEARAAIEASDLPKARVLLHKYLAISHQPVLDEEGQSQMFRNSAVDMLDALSSVENGARAGSVAAYLKARIAFDEEFTFEKVEAL